MKTFLTIWFGQFISRIGTAMTRFALLIWIYEQTSSASSVALLGFASLVPMLLVSPFAGVIIDRFPRRNILICSDLGAGTMTIGLLLLVVTGNFQLWHLYLAASLTGTFEAFQIPTYSAVMATLLPTDQLGRGNGLRSLADFGSQIAAPVMGGLLLSIVGLGGVMAIDITTFLTAIGLLLLIRIPETPQAGETNTTGNWQQELRVGFRVIWHNQGLRAMVLLSMMLHLIVSLTWVSILPAFILARSGNSELVLASVQSAIGIGGVLGGLLMGIWGGPKRKIKGLIFGIVLSYLGGDVVMAIGRTPTTWIIGGALGAFLIPILDGSREAIWQNKIPMALQGRVFAVRNMLRDALIPFGFLASGILADRVLEPAMAVDGALVPTFGWLVGSGPGAGMALMFFTAAVASIIVCLAAFTIPAVRHVEDTPIIVAAPVLPMSVVAAGD